MMFRKRLVQTTNAIIGEAGAGFDGAGAGFMPDHPQGKVMALAVAEISIIADVHGRTTPCRSVIETIAGKHPCATDHHARL
jgi:hypothetical protein